MIIIQCTASILLCLLPYFHWITDIFLVSPLLKCPFLVFNFESQNNWVFLVFFPPHLWFLPARNKIQWNQNDLKQKSKATEFIDLFSHITSDVICYVHTTNKLEENTWSVTQVNKHLAYEVLPCCLYYVDKITSVRRKKYKVQSTSGKFSHLDIWKICMFNLHWHQFHFIKMKFYQKIWKKKKHEGGMFRECTSISAWA